MRVVVIGATGHIGGYLVPRLVARGHEVVALSRGRREPYRTHPAWSAVERVTVDRDAEDAADRFGRRVAELGADVVVDLVCFSPASAEKLVEALRGTGTFLVHCGTIWVHGHGVEVPVTEDAPRRPFGEYGTAKAAIERLLLDRARRGVLRATVLHPGHIVGPGWVPVNPAGNADLAVYARLAAGEEVALPGFGLETLHHVHADDVAQAFERAIDHPGAACGESFHVVSERAVTLRGFAEAVASWFGVPARLTFLPWDRWRETVGPEEASTSWEHVARSPSMSIAKARSLLGYSPRYSSLQAVAEALGWLVANGRLDTGGRFPAL